MTCKRKKNKYPAEVKPKLVIHHKYHKSIIDRYNYKMTI